MTKRALTLLELLVAMTMMAIITGAAAAAWNAAFQYRTTAERVRTEHDARVRFEDRLRYLIAGAVLTSDAGDAASYFRTPLDDGTSGQPASSLVFTSGGTRVPASYRAADDTLEVLNEQFGPVGGFAELSLSITALGETNGQTGLFLREQRPPDADSEQGGYESVLDRGVEQIGFEFFDGSTWVSSWDTNTGERRLPAAVRVTYRRTGESDRQLVVAVPASDVTIRNPIGGAQ